MITTSGTMPDIYKFNIGNYFVIKATKAIEDFIEEQDEKTLKIAISGGSSPKAVYERLAKSDRIDWARIELFQVDERGVPEESQESNKRMIQDTLISKITPPKKFHFFDTSKPIERALETYEKKLQKLNRPYFDLMLLGLGSDGHTASLFPHGPELEEVERLVTHSKSPTPPHERLTLTYPAIFSSRKIIFLIRGADKQKTVSQWLDKEADEKELPAAAILDHPDVAIYYDYSH